MSQRLLLVGAGMAHVEVLRTLGQRRLADASILLAAPFPRQFFARRLPGWLAGRYAIDDCTLAIQPLAQRAGAELLPAHIVGLNLEKRLAYTDAGYALDFDLVSIDCGTSINVDAIPGAAEHAVALRPLEDFSVGWIRLREQLAEAQLGATLTIVGGGAAGCEIALAIASGAPSWQPKLRVQIVTGTDGAVPTLPIGARDRLLGALARAGIRVIEDRTVDIGRGTTMLADGGELNSDGVILATGPAALAWPGRSGLAVDRRGFIQVGTNLLSTSHPFVFAAGACAAIAGHPRPKSDLFAVQAGAVLAKNLRRYCLRRPLRHFVPQSQVLNLMSVGMAGHPAAIASWGGFCFEAPWLARVKDFLDGRALRRNIGTPESSKRPRDPSPDR